MSKMYNICSKCIMDTSDPDIRFDIYNICNHCKRYDILLSSRVVEKDIRDEVLKKLVKQIKISGKSKDYDCIIGVSGGVDSTYVAYLCKNLGLRPLAVHFDNGWNSELAVSNIEKTLNKLNIDLYTYVIDWRNFKEIQKAFLHSSTPDCEVPTDHAINALLFKEASRRGIKYVINGMNFATESVSVPMWSYGHQDWKYIKYISKKFGKKVNFKGYPHFSFFKLFFYTFIRRIKVISILNYVEYNKEGVMNIIEDKLGWKYYGGKHYESVYTRFFQGYYLIKKFGIDKRRGHLSDLIRNGQITRENALEEIKQDAYKSQFMKDEDLDFVLKKFDLTNDEFQEIIKKQNKSYRDFPNSENIVKFLKNLVNFLRKKNMYSK